MANIKPLQHFLLIFYLKSIYKIVFKYYLLFLILITPCHDFNTRFNPHDKRAKKIFYIRVGDNCSVLLPFNSQDIESVICPADCYTFSWKLLTEENLVLHLENIPCLLSLSILITYLQGNILESEEEVACLSILESVSQLPYHEPRL